MKIIAITLTQPLRSLRPVLDHLEVGKTHPYQSWTVELKGPSVFIASPIGWRAGQSHPDPNVKTRTVFEVPRTLCVLRYEDDGAGDLPSQEPPRDDRKNVKAPRAME